MRKANVLFANVKNSADLLKVLFCLHKSGTLHSHHFDFDGAGYGEAVLCTDLSDKVLQEKLNTLLPHVWTGVGELSEEACHDCQSMVARQKSGRTRVYRQYTRHRPGFFDTYFATARASSSLTERSLETPSPVIVTP